MLLYIWIKSIYIKTKTFDPTRTWLTEMRWLPLNSSTMGITNAFWLMYQREWLTHSVSKGRIYRETFFIINPRTSVMRCNMSWTSLVYRQDVIFFHIGWGLLDELPDRLMLGDIYDSGRSFFYSHLFIVNNHILDIFRSLASILSIWISYFPLKLNPSVRIRT